MKSAVQWGYMKNNIEKVVTELRNVPTGVRDKMIFLVRYGIIDGYHRSLAETAKIFNMSAEGARKAINKILAYEAFKNFDK